MAWTEDGIHKTFVRDTGVTPDRIHATFGPEDRYLSAGVGSLADIEAAIAAAAATGKGALLLYSTSGDPSLDAVLLDVCWDVSPL